MGAGSFLAWGGKAQPATGAMDERGRRRVYASCDHAKRAAIPGSAAAWDQRLSAEPSRKTSIYIYIYRTFLIPASVSRVRAPGSRRIRLNARLERVNVLDPAESSAAHGYSEGVTEERVRPSAVEIYESVKRDAAEELERPAPAPTASRTAPHARRDSSALGGVPWQLILPLLAPLGAVVAVVALVAVVAAAARRWFVEEQRDQLQ